MFPPRSGACAREIDGAHTEILVTEYTDRVLVVATQIGKLGTIFHLTRNQSGEFATLDADANDDLSRCATLIGRRDDEILHACARAIGHGLFARGLEKPVVCALGLRRECGTAAKRAVATTCVELASELLGLASGVSGYAYAADAA